MEYFQSWISVVFDTEKNMEKSHTDERVSTLFQRKTSTRLFLLFFCFNKRYKLRKGFWKQARVKLKAQVKYTSTSLFSLGRMEGGGALPCRLIKKHYRRIIDQFESDWKTFLLSTRQIARHCFPMILKAKSVQYFRDLKENKTTSY